MVGTIKRLLLEAESMADILGGSIWAEEACSLKECAKDAREVIERYKPGFLTACSEINRFLDLIEPAATDKELASVTNSLEKVRKYIEG